MGNKNAKFPVSISLTAVEACQIRHNALEAARVAANRYLTNNLGRANYHLKIRVHPHHVLRENKMMTFAGADRLQDGMRKAFGKAVGTAARVRPGQSLITVHLNPDGGHIDIAREALRRAKYKFSTPCKIIIEKGEELLS